MGELSNADLVGAGLCVGLVAILYAFDACVAMAKRRWFAALWWALASVSAAILCIRVLLVALA